MGLVVSFKTPKPVSVNHMYITRGRYRVLSSEYREFKQHIVATLQHAISDRVANKEEKYKVVITYVINNLVRRDLDNVLKPLFDGITDSGLVWEDDSQVWTLEITKEMDREAEMPYLKVEVYSES